MKTQLLPILIGSLLALAHGEGTQNPIAPTIESVAMFKNGVAIVHAGFEASEPGDYVWIDPPRAVHGAFFVESAPGLTIRSTTRWMKPEETPLPTGNLQRDLAGAGVCVSLPGENGKTWVEISGKVQAPPVPEHANWNTDYTTTRSRHSWSYYSSSVLPQNRQNPVPAGNWLVIDQDGKRQIVYIGGNDYHRTTVKGTLKVTNTRADPVKLVIRTDFSGKLLAADGEPEKSLRVSGVSSVNPRRRLEWTFQLKNGESKTLEYRYSVLVDR